MKVEVKDLDGQRSMSIEVTEDLPGSLFVYEEGRFCHEFDVAIFTRAVARAQDKATV